MEYPSTWGISKYGPNKFHNEKTKYISQSVITRFDSNGRSTFVPNGVLTPDSVQIGLFADPQDFKNRDIVRYFGNHDFMDSIGAPSNRYADSYQSLKYFRSIYAESKNEYSGSKTLFNDLITLYKLYFNRSIFDSISNLMPARSKPLVGVVIEPTILERPKYAARRIESSMSESYFEDYAKHYSKDPVTKLEELGIDLIWTEFNTNWADTPQFDQTILPVLRIATVSGSYVNLPNRDYPVNYGGNYIAECMDNIQFGHFSGDGVGGFKPVAPYIVPPIFNMNEELHPSGSGIGSSYMLKKWKKYTICAHTGPWVRTDNPRDNLYTTNSIYLYDYVIVTDDFWNSVVYTASFVSTVPGDPGSEVPQSASYWYHYANTFQNSPNAVTNNYSYAYQLTTPFGGRLVAIPGQVTQSAQDTYFEIVKGYPRNHYVHKRNIFSLYTLQTYGRNYSTSSVGTYVRCQQTYDTTIGSDGLTNGSSPVETMTVGNVNAIQSNNVINQ